MSTMHDYLKTKMGDEAFRGTAYTWPATLYFALVTTAPTASTPGTEVGAGLGYSRASLASTTGDWSNTTGVVVNLAALNFGTATADWGTVVAVEVYDAAVAGNALCWATLSPSRNITNGTTVSIPVSDLTFTWS